MRVNIERPDILERAELRQAITQYDLAPAVLVEGTGHGEWAEPGSPWRRHVLETKGNGLVVATILGPLRTLSPKGDWYDVSRKLIEILAQLGGAAHLVCHSHGLQPVAEAVAEVPVASVFSISGPVREDMADVYAAMLRNAQRFTQAQAKEWDRTQWIGQWFGRLANPFARRGFPDDPPRVRTFTVKGVGHSKLLYNVDQFNKWTPDMTERL